MSGESQIVICGLQNDVKSAYFLTIRWAHKIIFNEKQMSPMGQAVPQNLEIFSLSDFQSCSVPYGVFASSHFFLLILCRILFNHSCLLLSPHTCSVSFHMQIYQKWVSSIKFKKGSKNSEIENCFGSGTVFIISSVRFYHHTCKHGWAKICMDYNWNHLLWSQS